MWRLQPKRITMKIIMASFFTIFSISLISELNSDPVDDERKIGNIQKVLTFIKDYHRGYHYYRTYISFWINEGNDEDEEYYDVLDYEFGYIKDQVEYGINFSELYSIFMAQILASIYALKLKERLDIRLNEYNKEQAEIEKENYIFLARYGVQSESVSPAIMNILDVKFPESYEEFERVSTVFDKFRQEMRQLFLIKSIEYEEKHPNIEKDLQAHALELIEYVKTALLQIPNKLESGLGIDADAGLKNLWSDMKSLRKWMNQDPNQLYPNYDQPGMGMYQSTVMQLLKNLIEKVAQSSSPQVYLHSIRPTFAVLLVQPWENDPGKLVFTMINTFDIDILFPKAAEEEPNTNDQSLVRSLWRSFL